MVHVEFLPKAFMHGSIRIHIRFVKKSYRIPIEFLYDSIQFLYNSIRFPKGLIHI